MIALHAGLGAESELRAAVVTGAAGGIGAVISRRLCEQGWNVAGLGRSAKKLSSARAGLRGLPGSFMGVVGDVRREDDVAQLFETTAAEFGRVCAVVANSGMPGPTAPVADTDLADWQAVIATNLTGAFLTVRAAVPYLRRTGWGRIVLIGSTTGKNPVAGRSAYAASKTGLIGLTRVLAAEVGPHSITVNLVCPGVVAGARWDRVAATLAAEQGSDVAAITAAYAEKALLKRIVEPGEVADVVRFLLSPKAAAITGQDLNVCAGLITS